MLRLLSIENPTEETSNPLLSDFWLLIQVLVGVPQPVLLSYAQSFGILQGLYIMHERVLIKLIYIGQFEAPPFIRELLFLGSFVLSLPELQHKRNHGELLFRFDLGQNLQNLSFLPRSRLIPVDIDHTNIGRVQFHGRKSLDPAQITRDHQVPVLILQADIFEDMIRPVLIQPPVGSFKSELVTLSDQVQGVGTR